MANCSNCGAPLPPNSTLCDYCQTRNDVDLKGIHYHTEHPPQESRFCPRCRQALQSINLAGQRPFLIERCGQCFGLFFDPGELEALLEQETAHVYDIDFQSLNRMLLEQRASDHPVAYLKCPVCRTPMHRANYGARSGVIVDRCKAHGVWLDGGELRQLMEWVKSGGAILHQKRMQEEKREEEKRRLEKEKEAAKFSARFDPQFYADQHRPASDTPDILSLLARWVGKMTDPR